MKIKLFILVVFFSELAFAESYSCAPLFGSENFKGADNYKIVKQKKLVYLYVSDNSEHDWAYEVVYEKSGNGFRASRAARDDGSEVSKLFSIAIGGELTLMNNFQPNEGISVLVTYALSLIHI